MYLGQYATEEVVENSTHLFPSYPLTNKDVSRICYIKKGADGQRYFYYQTNNEQQETLETYNEGKDIAWRYFHRTGRL